MHITQHADTRMNQRGIRRQMIDLALEHGRAEGDRFILSRQDAIRRIDILKQEQKLLEHAASKGGVTIVYDNDAIITTYAGLCRSKQRK